MLEQVENKINEFKKQQQEEYYRKKDEDLLQWGLTGRKDGKKVVPIVITDEEYEALIEASGGIKNSGRNKMSSVLNVCSIVIITLGIIIGGVALVAAENLGAIYLTVSIVCSLLFALLFRGISEAINLLQQVLDSKRLGNVIKMNKQEDLAKAEEPQKFQKEEAAASAPAAPTLHFTFSDDEKLKF